MNYMYGSQVSLSVLDGSQDRGTLVSWLTSSDLSNSAGTSRFLTTAMAEQLLDSAVTLLVTPHGGEPMGGVQWRTLGYSGSYSLSIIVGDEKSWRTECGAEALFLALRYLFHSLNAHRVETITGLYSSLMVELAVNARMTVEGVLRDYFFLDGAYHNGAVFSLLRDEFYEFLKERGEVTDVIADADKHLARRMLTDYLSERSPGNVPTWLET